TPLARATGGATPQSDAGEAAADATVWGTRVAWWISSLPQPRHGHITTQQSGEIHDGDRATQCPDQGLAAGDYGAPERCQSLAGLVSGNDGDRHRRSLPRGRGQGRGQGEVGGHVAGDYRERSRLPVGPRAA